jgi:hypothetical protein
MDSLHGVLRSIRTETKSAKDPLHVFREFLAQLDALARHPPPKPPRAKSPPRRKPLRRGRG